MYQLIEEIIDSLINYKKKKEPYHQPFHDHE